MLRPLLLIPFVAFSSVLFAQLPPICPTDEVPEMTPFCEDACVICDIDGFRGRNGRDRDYELPDDFCTLQQHNGKWIGFVAGSVDLAISMSVSNCEQNDGLEIAIYRADDCQNFTVVSDCFGGFGLIRPNSSRTFRNLEPLVIGQHYYLVMDGGRNDVCDWEFRVVEGSTQLGQLQDVSSVSGPRRVCPGIENTFTAPEQIGATEFTWTVDGEVVGRERQLNYAFPEEGEFQLCVRPRNACDEANRFCFDVAARFVPERTETVNLCFGDAFEVDGTTITEAGVYPFAFITSTGCDSLVTFDVRVISSTTDDIQAFFCNDDVLEYNGEIYTEPGVYEQVLTNRFGCDSVIRLDARAIECNIEASGDGAQVQCAGDGNGTYAFTVTQGTPPFTYELAEIGNSPLRSGAVAAIGQATLLENLSGGNYQLTIRDEFGNDTRILNVVIFEPERLEATETLSDYGGFNVSCAAAADGTLTVMPSGGTLPYVIAWEDGGVGFTRSGLAAGDYTYLVTDRMGCTTRRLVRLRPPTRIGTDLMLNEPDCTGPNSGSVSVLDAFGGAGGPYRYRLDAGPAKPIDSTFTGLSAGNYNLTLEDQNGCTTERTFTFLGKAIPQIFLPDVLAAELGTSISLTPSTLDADSLFYELPPGATLLDSTTNGVRLLATTPGFIHVTAVSPDSCSVRDSVEIALIRNRAVYAPTAFSPNGDGVNDVFFLNPGPGVAQIQSLRVFDRWGGEVFSATDAMTAENGWDGRSGRNLPAGTYVWTARALFLDGEVRMLRGNVVLLR